MKKNDKLDNNTAKLKKAVCEKSSVSSLMIKIYDEQIMRVYADSFENDKMHKYVQELLDLTLQKTSTEELLEKEKDDTNRQSLTDKIEELKNDISKVKKDKAEWSYSLCKNKGYYDAFFNNLESIDNEEYEIYGILHDKDLQIEDFFNYKADIQHIHIGVRSLKTTGKVQPVPKRFEVEEMCKMLKVEFREDLDKKILDNDAIDIVKKWHNYVYYLTHEDDNSRIEGKHVYEREEIHMNVTSERYLATIRGINRITHTKVTKEEIAEVFDDIAGFGQEGKPFDLMMKTIFPNTSTRNYIKVNEPILKAVQKAYNTGADEWIATFPTLDSHCIFIYGEYDTGKSSAITSALEQLNVDPKTIHIPKGADDLTLYLGLTTNHKWAVFDDVSMKMILKVADKKPTYVRCMFGYTLCALENIIVVSNKSPKEYFHLDDENPDKRAQGEAMLSRFAVFKTSIYDNSLVLEQYMKRGTRGTSMFFDNKRWINNLVDKINPSLIEYGKKDKMDNTEMLLLDTPEEYDAWMWNKHLAADDDYWIKIPDIKKFLEYFRYYYNIFNDTDAALDEIQNDLRDEYMTKYLRERYEQIRDIIRTCIDNDVPYPDSIDYDEYSVLCLMFYQEV